MSIQKNIAQRLRLAMFEQNASLSEYSEKIGIAKSTLQEYLKGTSSPRADTIELLSERMGCSPAELLSDPDAAGSYPNQRTDPPHPMLLPLLRQLHAMEEELIRLSAFLEQQESE